MTSGRWRITLDELVSRSHTDARTLAEWARNGALGPRFKEHRNAGWAKHITREAAQRCVIFSRLMNAGLTQDTALAVITHHETGEDGDLSVYVDENVMIRVNRRGLP